MQETINTDERRDVIFYSIIGMLISLFCSRLLLSIFMMVFVAVSFFHPDLKKHLRNFFSNTLLWGMTLLFFFPLLSGLWSSDKNAWLDVIRIKLPLLFLPLAFAVPIQFSKKQWDWLAFIFVALVTAGSLWSMFHYVTNVAIINNGYLYAKMLITPLKNDHVRFSWLGSVAILLTSWLWIKKRKDYNILSWLLPVIIIWLIIFLHILAARTGLISFYLIVFFSSLWFLYKKINPGYAIILLAIIIALPFIAYRVLPTFQNKVKYFLYDQTYFKDARYLQGANDAVRVISIKAGWNIMNEHPVTGVGFGDIFTETKKWYGIHYPEMIETDKIYPSSEWMMYGAGIGCTGLLILIGVIIISFLAPVKNKLPWMLLNIMAAFSFLFDIPLEVQFGVFIYSFIMLWCWKWFNAENI